MSRDSSEVRGRAIQVLLIAAGVAVFVGAIAFPVGVLLCRVLAGPEPSGAALDFPLALLAKTVALAAAAVAVSLLIAVPAAHVVSRLGEGPVDLVAGVFLMTPLTLPAMVYALGWERVLPFPDWLRCVMVWASWSWPVPAVFVGRVWSRRGRKLYEEALLECDPFHAVVRAVIPVLWRPLVACGLFLFAFFLGDYAVPHSCKMVVYATELLLRAEASGSPADTLIASLPVVFVITLSLGGALVVWRGREVYQDAPCDGQGCSLGWRVVVPVVLAGVCVVVPLFVLGQRVQLGAAMEETLRIYGGDVVDSVWLAALGGLTSVFLGSCVVTSVRMRSVCLVCAMLSAVVPGAIVGGAIAGAYLSIAVIYDHWPIMLLGYVARFGWIGILVAQLARDSVASELMSAARADGASELAVGWHIGLGSNVGLLLAGAMVIASLCLSEVAAVSLLRIPQVNPVSLIIIEKFHRFEDGIMISLSLLIVLVAIPGAVMAGMVVRRFR